MDPFQDRTHIYRNRLISKYLIPQQNFMNLLQEKLPSSLTGINEQEQVCLFFRKLIFNKK
jgi:hypothetical protein